MGKYSDFTSQTPLVRTKSAIYTPKRDNETFKKVLRDDEHPCDVNVGVFPRGLTSRFTQSCKSAGKLPLAQKLEIAYSKD